MSTLNANLANDAGILLEAGTNEAEVLVFRVKNSRFGVNVAKVREVLPIEDFTEIPKSDPSVDGLVAVREVVVPLVNLARYLYDADLTENAREDQSMVLLEFNDQQVAFRVQEIERIYRVSWRDTLPAPRLGEQAAPVTSVLRQKDGLVPLLDFESICARIGIGISKVDQDMLSHIDSAEQGQRPIVYIDDSQLISEMVHDALVGAGYRDLKGFADGQAAWEYLHNLAGDDDPEAFRSKVACIITDIEMPRMDGLTFTKRVREHPAMADTPVIVFSSIASKDNEKKGVQVGATAQVSKPNYNDLITTVGTLVAT